MKKLYIILTIFIFFIGGFYIINFFPLKFSLEVEESSKNHNIKKEMIYSIIKIESDFRPKVISHKGAIGLMQIMPQTGQWIAELNQLDYNKNMLMTPQYNIDIGTLYLKYLMNKYNEDVNSVLIAYNAGPSRLEDESWKNFKETKNYLVKYQIASFFYKIRLIFT